MTGVMSTVSAIAVSGMNAAMLRLQVSAGNVANAFTEGPLPGAPNASGYSAAYVPLRVDQVDMAGGGTRASVGTVTPSFVATYDPDAPFADGEGMVASPNVDLADEAVKQIMARYSYAANAAVVRVDAQVTATLLDTVV